MVFSICGNCIIKFAAMFVLDGVISTLLVVTGTDETRLAIICGDGVSVAGAVAGLSDEIVGD